ncbi:MAG: SGNH/GDSL hydrolase family protein [Desulfobacteraceae bacterium]|nr:MAG: SGNH/GDSL hydrolase family protein [Desulfobacteraceae bacterium]
MTEITYGIIEGPKRRSGLRWYLRSFFRLLKWSLIAAVVIEIASFLIVTGSNYILYGNPREGRGVRYDPYTLFLNREGQRATPHPFAPGRDTKTKRYWLFGGSTMRGATDDDAKTIAAFLAGMINREGGIVYHQVHNFGENSFNSLLEVKYLQKQLIDQPSRPDVILFYDGANECVYLAQHRTPFGHYGYRKITSLVNSYDRSFFGLLKPLNAAIHASFTRELHDKIMQTMSPVREDRPLLESFVKESEKRYDHVHALAHSMGSRFFVVLQPNWWVETLDVSQEVKNREEAIAKKAKMFKAAKENFNTVYDALSSGLRDKPYFVDFRNILTSRSEPAYQMDGVHLTDKGREMVAAGFERLFRDKGLLDDDRKADAE